MEDKKRLSFGYEDTDKSIEIVLYGLVFEIKNLDNLKELENIKQDDFSVIETQLENILGAGAIEKINNKRINDGYKKMDLNIELNILGCIFETYAKSSIGNVLNKVTGAVEGMNRDIDSLGNREQRRNYNRNNNYYRGNRRNYRRY